MAKTSRHRANGTKQAERVRLAIRQARILNAKKTGKRYISDAVLRALAEARLPPDKCAYEFMLHELEHNDSLPRPPSRNVGDGSGGGGVSAMTWPHDHSPLPVFLGVK
jgi:hypothetical protein